jgi:hypothetical protein
MEMENSLKDKFKINDKINLILCLIMSLSIIIMSYIPKEFTAIRTILLSLGMLCTGIVISQHASIWQKVNPKND